MGPARPRLLALPPAPGEPGAALRPASRGRPRRGRSYPVELAAQAVEGLRLALAAHVGLVHGEVLAAVPLRQQAARLVAADLGRAACEAGGRHPPSLAPPPPPPARPRRPGPAAPGPPTL